MYLSVLSSLLLVGENVELWKVVLGTAAILSVVFAVIFWGRQIGGFLEPRLKLRSHESFVVVIFPVLLVVALLVEKIHIAEVIGALLLGLVLAETIHAKRIIQFITPLRDLFGAVFFFSFGLNIDYRLLESEVYLALGAVLMTVLGNIVTGALSAWLAGYKRRQMANVAFSIIARGEFAIIGCQPGGGGGCQQ